MTPLPCHTVTSPCPPPGETWLGDIPGGREGSCPDKWAKPAPPLTHRWRCGPAGESTWHSTVCWDGGPESGGGEWARTPRAERLGPRGLSRGTAPPAGPTTHQVGFPPALSPVAGSSISAQAVVGPVGACLSHPPVCSHLQRGGGRQHLGPFLPARERASLLCTGSAEEGGGRWINGDRGRGRRTGGTHRASTRPCVWSNTEMLPLRA